MLWMESNFDFIIIFSWFLVYESDLHIQPRAQGSFAALKLCYGTEIVVLHVLSRLL